MSFYTIQNPGNRNEEVKKYLELKNYLRTKDSAEKTGDFTRIEELSKFFKPVSQPIEEIKALSVASKTKETKEKNIFFNDPELNKYVNLAKNDQLIDLDLVGEQPKILLAGYPLNVKSNSIEYFGRSYTRTPELMDLIFSPEPSPKKDTKAYNDFKDIMRDSNALVVKSQLTGNLINNPTINQRNKRWKNLLKHISLDLKTGSGLHGTPLKKGGKHETVFLSSNPVTLADRLALLCASAKAGNTGVRNEMVEICKELIRMGAMTTQQKSQILNNYNIN